MRFSIHIVSEWNCIGPIGREARICVMPSSRFRSTKRNRQDVHLVIRGRHDEQIGSAKARVVFNNAFGEEEDVARAATCGIFFPTVRRREAATLCSG